jgi:hypothetical protein
MLPPKHNMVIEEAIKKEIGVVCVVYLPYSALNMFNFHSRHVGAVFLPLIDTALIAEPNGPMGKQTTPQTQIQYPRNQYPQGQFTQRQPALRNNQAERLRLLMITPIEKIKTKTTPNMWKIMFREIIAKILLVIQRAEEVESLA